MENKTSKNILLTIMGVLILAMFVVAILCFNANLIKPVGTLVSLVFIALYGFLFYKKPHGNLLKYTMLIFAASKIISNINFGVKVPTMLYTVYFTILASAAVCYCAGRLNRFDQNKILLPIIDVVYLIMAIITICDASHTAYASFLLTCNLLSTPLFMTTLMIAYFVRYKEHKEAGVMDAPKA